ncbi:MAG: ABC transporter ATP-binding protein [Oscillospiraceae bacterium]
MGKPVIQVNNVSVKYLTGDLRNIGLKEYIMKKLTHTYHNESFVAVNHVTFSLEQGDMLGIVGMNGAGKSTLLKVITQIMVPSTGSVMVDGKVAALLELSSGFDGELNLKENAYLRGAMLGYTREFMDKKYPEIIEFSGLKEFENRPFKLLSSGMKSKIAFSIASMLEPEILILDEVLSVGDGAFREKSEKKMLEIIKNGKVTILVSHSLGQIRRLCNKVLWLDRGEQMAFGDTKEVCDRYEEFLKAKNAEKPKREW